MAARAMVIKAILSRSTCPEGAQAVSALRYFSQNEPPHGSLVFKASFSSKGKLTIVGRYFMRGLTT
jgi:hypothetical protein